MKQTVFFVALILCLSSLMACNHSSEEKNEKGHAVEFQAEQYYKRLEGKMGDHPTILHLIKLPNTEKEQDTAAISQYSGILLPGNGRGPLTVAGFQKRDSSIQLVTYSHYNPIDTLNGRFFGKVLEGKMTDPDSRLFEFSFQEQYPEGSFHWEVARHTDSALADSTRSSTISAKTNLMALWPGKDITEANHALFTDSICRSFFGTQRVFPTPDKLLSVVSDSFLLNYRENVKRLLENQGEIRPSFSWNLHTDMDITCNKANKISLLYTQYQFTGGAHGMQSVFCLNVDTKTGKTLHLSDLFQPGYEEALQQKLEEKLRQQYNIPDGEPLNGDAGLLFDAHLPVSSNFYLTPEGVGFIYNPYDVAPYVVGEINLYLPFSKIKALMKK